MPLSLQRVLSPRNRLLVVLGMASTTLPVFAQVAPPADSQPELTRNALNHAVYKADLNTVKAIVATRPEFVNGAARQTPLDLALQGGQIEIVRVLLEHGADPNAGGWRGTPLPLAQVFSRPDNQWKTLGDLLVQHGASVDTPDQKGLTVLQRVLQSSTPHAKEQVVWLLSHGANVNWVSPLGLSVLNIAITKAPLDVARLVLSKADLKQRDGQGQTLLFTAVKSVKLDIIKDLIERGVDVNAQNIAGDTPLHVAARGDENGMPSRELLTQLLAAGAKPNLPNTCGDLPLHVSLRHNISLNRTFNLPIGDYPAPPNPNAIPRGLQLVPLLDKTNINTRGNDGFSPLLLALVNRDAESSDLIRARHPQLDSLTALCDAVARGDSLKVTEILKTKPYLVSFHLPDGSTPLHIAALWGTLQCARTLVASGADLNARDGQNFTPLHVALKNPTDRFMRRAINMTTFLLGAGANPNIASFKGDTPLHLAARVGNTQLITSLLNKGAHINARSADGETALLILTNRTTTGAFYKDFLARGADVDSRGAYMDRDDPARKETSFTQGQFTHYFPDSGNRIMTPLHRAVLARRADLVAALLDKKANVESLDGDGHTPLVRAILSPNTDSDDITSLLLSKGANPNQELWMMQGDDLLAYAVDHSSPDKVNALLASRKISLKPDVRVKSLLSRAITRGNVEVVRALLDAGADLNVTSATGNSLLQLATSDALKKLLSQHIAQHPAPKVATPAPAQSSPATGALVNAAARGDLTPIKEGIAANPDILKSGTIQPILSNALRGHQIENVRFLLEQGVNPNMNFGNSTPLIDALHFNTSNWEPMVNLLLEKGADLKSVNNVYVELFPNMLQADDGTQKAKTIWMLAHGADVQAPHHSAFQDLQSALDVATMYSGDEVRELVVAKADVKRRDVRGETALFAAVRAARPDVVRNLLQRGADVNAQNSDGDTPLHIAARLTYPYPSWQAPQMLSLLTLLLDAGANPNLPNGSGDLPMHLALRYKASLDQSFDPQLDETPFFPESAPTSRSPQLSLLINKTDANLRGNSGLPPLLVSIMMRDAEGCDLLRDQAPKNDPLTAFFDAVARGDSSAVAQTLKAKRYLAFYRLPDGSTALHIAALWGTTNCAEQLVKCGADVNPRNMYGQTPLHSALLNPTGLFMRRAVTMTGFLLNHGAAVNAATPSGDAPIHFAAKAGNEELCELLLSKGASLNARGSHGDTALFILTNPSTSITFYKSLLARGADVNARGLLSVKDVPSPSNWNHFSNAPQGVSSSNLSTLDIVGFGMPLHRAVLARRSNLATALLEAGANTEALDARGQTPLNFAVSTYNGNSRGDSDEVVALLRSQGAKSK